MKLFVFSIICGFLRVSHQNPRQHWTLMPNSRFDLHQNMSLKVWITLSYLLWTPAFVNVSPDSSGFGRGWHFGLAEPEVHGVSAGAHGDRKPEPRYFLEEEWKRASSERKHIPRAARGKLRRRQLHLPQQGWIASESHRCSDPRGRDQKEEDSRENWPRCVLLWNIRLSQWYSGENLAHFKASSLQFASFSLNFLRLSKVLCSKLRRRVPLLLDLAQQSQWQSSVYQSSPVRTQYTAEMLSVSGSNNNTALSLMSELRLHSDVRKYPVMKGNMFM